MDIKEYAEFLIKGLCEVPEEVKVTSSTDEMGIFLSVVVAPIDMGKIIGKMGVTANALRTILRQFGFKNHARVSMKLVDPLNGGIPARRPSYGGVDTNFSEELGIPKKQ